MDKRTGLNENQTAVLNIFEELINENKTLKEENEYLTKAIKLFRKLLTENEDLQKIIEKLNSHANMLERQINIVEKALVRSQEENTALLLEIAELEEGYNEDLDDFEDECEEDYDEEDILESYLDSLETDGLSSDKENNLEIQICFPDIELLSENFPEILKQMLEGE